MNFADHEELADRQRRRRRRRQADMFWNLMTICVLLLTVLAIGLMMMVFSNPYISINPFPPPTLPVLVVLPTSTSTLVYMPPTWTPTSEATETPEPVYVTATSNVTATETVALPTETPNVSTPNVNAPYAFIEQGQPAAIRSVVFKPETGCDWQGVAGVIVDLQGKPLVQVTIELKGVYNGKTISMRTISGTHTEYGESGYEFQIGTELIASSGSLSIQLLDATSQPLSDQVVFDTYATCDKNLTVINFKQVR